MDASKIIRAARLPLHLLAVMGGSSNFLRNPILGSARLNRAGLHAGRVALAGRMAGLRRSMLGPRLDTDDRATFARDGILVKQEFLPAEQFKRLRAELLGLAAPAREHWTGDALNRLIPLTRSSIAGLPEASAMFASHDWRGRLRHVAAATTPPLLFLQTIFAHARPASPDPQTNLHSDTFYPTMKAWLYLDDVAEDDGPFVYVAGSHRNTPARLAWEKARSIGWRDADALTQRGSLRVTPEELDALGLPQPRLHAVPANTLVVADTHGFHARAPASGPSQRIAIFAVGRGSPFLPVPLPSPRALLGGHEVLWWWSILDRLHARGLAKQFWTDVGLARAGDPPGPRSPPPYG